MNRLVCWTLIFSVNGIAQTIPARSLPDNVVTLAAVARDPNLLAAVPGRHGRLAQQGNVMVEPFLRLNQSEELEPLPCIPGTGKSCVEFAREFLSKPHTYTIVSADGRGTSIHAAPTTLSECYDFVGKGTYSGRSIAYSAIAATSDKLFADSSPLTLLSEDESLKVRKSIVVLAPKRLSSSQQLRIWAATLEGQSIMIVQKVSGGALTTTEEELSDPVFAVGTMDRGSFRPLNWNHRATADEEERVIGTIRLKTGKEFLVAVVNDSESHSFRIYGVRSGKIALLYSGGGSSC